MIMGEVSAESVFKPGCFSRYTYVCRQAPLIEETYEDKLEQDLKVSGCLISIVGPSKSGKTLLCEKVIENNEFYMFEKILNQDYLPQIQIRL